jgi:hypothetical protein
MDPNRPNETMASLVDQAIQMANETTRPKAAEFLYQRGCSIDVIARVLEKNRPPGRIRAATARPLEQSAALEALRGNGAGALPLEPVAGTLPGHIK